MNEAFVEDQAKALCTSVSRVNDNLSANLRKGSVPIFHLINCKEQ